MSSNNLSALIWSVADLLRGDFKQSDYGKVILPFTILRRLDCALEATKPQTLAEHAKRVEQGLDPSSFLPRITGYSFYNTSLLDLGKLLGDPTNIRQNLRGYLAAFSPNVSDIFEKFEFENQIDRLAGSNLLYLVTQKFAQIDLHPNVVSNADMGHAFEELIRKFAELSNETAGEHFTPREVIKLMVNLLFLEDSEALTKPGAIRTLYDPMELLTTDPNLIYDLQSRCDSLHLPQYRPRRRESALSHHGSRYAGGARSGKDQTGRTSPAPQRSFRRRQPDGIG